MMEVIILGTDYTDYTEAYAVMSCDKSRKGSMEEKIRVIRA